MQKLSDVQEFYALIEKWHQMNGGYRVLGDCHSKMNWPDRGVYFFFEDGEHIDGKPRVVRVGTHALREGSRTSVWQRLSQHRGTMKPFGGNHRGSIFRLLIGDALMRRDGADQVPSWGRETPTSADELRAEKQLEAKVSDYMARMKVLVLPIEDAAGPGSIRAFVERNAIALLSNLAAPTGSMPSQAWLGHHSTRPLIRASGLWNSQHVDAAYSSDLLTVMARLIDLAGQQG